MSNPHQILFKTRKNYNSSLYKKVHKKLLVLPALIKSKSPTITSQSWSIFDSKSSQILCGYNEKCVLEIASLTKIMTLYTAVKLSEKYNINIYNESIKISKIAAEMTGTTANLKEGYYINVIDLFYGLMLPSGNDAAYCIAEYFGGILNPFTMVKNFESKTTDNVINNSVDLFVYQMNRIAKNLGLKKSKFSNPHGLSDKNNHSNAKELGIIACAAKKNELISLIVKSKEHRCEMNNDKGDNIKLKWINTNFLLNSGFDGMKTGITPTAGPCLVASCKAFGVNDIIIVMLNSRSMESRWNEALLLKNFIGQKIIKLIHRFKEKSLEEFNKKLPIISCKKC